MSKGDTNLLVQELNQVLGRYTHKKKELSDYISDEAMGRHEIIQQYILLENQFSSSLLPFKLLEIKLNSFAMKVEKIITKLDACKADYLKLEKLESEIEANTSIADRTTVGYSFFLNQLKTLKRNVKNGSTLTSTEWKNLRVLNESFFEELSNQTKENERRLKKISGDLTESEKSKLFDLLVESPVLFKSKINKIEKRIRKSNQEKEIQAYKNNIKELVIERLKNGGIYEGSYSEDMESDEFLAG